MQEGFHDCCHNNRMGEQQLWKEEMSREDFTITFCWWLLKCEHSLQVLGSAIVLVSGITVTFISSLFRSLSLFFSFLAAFAFTSLWVSVSHAFALNQILPMKHMRFHWRNCCLSISRQNDVCICKCSFSLGTHLLNVEIIFNWLNNILQLRNQKRPSWLQSGKVLCR